MIILIPLGGTGERFKDNNYKLPKALINIFGKHIIYYLLDCLDTTNVDFVYIPYNKEYAKYRFEDKLIKDYPNINFKFFQLNKNTDGAAHTINIALNEIKNNIADCPILCLDGDNFYTTNIVKIWGGENKIITIKDMGSNPIYSYIKTNLNNEITDIVEKNKISDNACTGAYGFKSYIQLHQYTQYIIDNNIKQKNEYYTSNVIKQMILNNILFRMEEISLNDWHCLGTPFQVKIFYNNFPRISSINGKNMIKKLRLCFDLDNTLVSFPKIKDDYTTVEPINENISFLRYLKKFEHTIIIHTARRMKTHNGNMGKLMKDIGKITFDTLEKFDIPYDEIYFGKPQADVYIDDLGLSCFDNLEKELGFYQDTILPREFNMLEKNSIETITKSSYDLSGEIYYYNNIPKQIKDIFPILIDYDLNNKWYIMEKIQGNTLTSFYLSELLTEEMLVHITSSIKRIQSINILLDNEDINIYDNYCNKLKDRYSNYDYSKFKDINNIYNKIYSKLDEYEKNNKGIKTVIHGDTVMTNILINKYGKIKFIDMRGKIGNKLSICGDFMYDWAKLYQSLIGYDSILQNKTIDTQYKNKLIIIFKNKFVENYSEEYFEYLKYITASLLFTLIPLHNNDKCVKYYELIDLCIN
jgi:capsule biosynthesis phosphatase